MKRNNLQSGLALLTSVLAIVASITMAHSNKIRLSNSQADNAQLIEATTKELRKELVDRLDSIIASLGLQEADSEETAVDPLDGNTDLKELAQLAKVDPTVSQLLQAGIKSVILEQMADELENVDWLDTLSQENLQKMLRKTANVSMSNGFNHQQSRVDVSGIDGMDGKIDRILEEFDGVNFYSKNNALVKQIAEMGEDAIEPLLNRLKDRSISQAWAKRSAVTDALEKLLTEEHEDLILAEFTKNGDFSKLIKKYQFPAAEDEVLNKIAHPLHGRVDQNVVDAALRMNAERSIPLLVDYVRYGQSVGYAARQLAAEGFDITEPLRMATTRVSSDWEKADLVELCLDRDMSEGYDLAVQVLLSENEHAEHSQEKVYNYIRKYTGINGSYAEVAQWLLQNQ